MAPLRGLALRKSVGRDGRLQDSGPSSAFLAQGCLFPSSTLGLPFPALPDVASDRGSFIAPTAAIELGPRWSWLLLPRFSSRSGWRRLVASRGPRGPRGGHGERLGRRRESRRPLAAIPSLAEAMPLCRAGAWLPPTTTQPASLPPNPLHFGGEPSSWNLSCQKLGQLDPRMRFDPCVLLRAASYRLGETF